MPFAFRFGQHIALANGGGKTIFSVVPESAAPARLTWPLLVFLVALGIFLFVIGTRHNAFPYTYHPDEDSKVRQIVSGKRNFFHPLLLLTTTSAAYHSNLIEKTPLNAAIIGRCVSAFFTALAIAALTLLAWRWGGWPSAIGAALLLFLNPVGFELEHYFKEDPALLFGLATTFLALDFFWKNPTRATSAFLGIAAALAISGKYLGAVVLLFVIPIVIVRLRSTNARIAWWCFGGFVAAIVLINLPLLRHWADFSHGLSREMDGATGGHRGLTREIPHAYYLHKLGEITPLAIWLALAATAISLLLAWKKSSAVQLLTLTFPFLFIALLSFSPKTATRYVLPATMFFSFLAGAAPGLLLRSEWPVKLRVISMLVASLFVAAGVRTQVPIFQKLYTEFSTDARDNLRQWIDQKTPSTAVIAQDERVDLLANQNWKNRSVRTSEFAADLGSLDELKTRGVTHVAVTRQSYNRFFSGLRPNSKEQAEFEKCAAFYRDLFQRGKLVWESPVGEIIYLHPGIRLYQIVP